MNASPRSGCAATMSLPSRTKRKRNAPPMALRSSAGSPQAARSDRRKSAGVEASSASYSASVSVGSSGPSARAAMSDGASSPQATSYPAARSVSAMATALAGVSESDRIAGATAARRIVRQDAGEALVGRRLAPEVRPAARQARRRSRPGRRAADARPRRIRSSRRARLAALKEMARVRIRPSISGSATCIARSAGPRPRSDARQASTLDAGQHHLHDRRVEDVERRSVGSVETGGERRRVEHDVEAAGDRERRASLRAPPRP